MNVAQSSGHTRNAARLAALVLVVAMSFVLLAPVASAAPGSDFTVSAPAIVKRGATLKVTINTGDDYTGKATLWYLNLGKWKKSSITADVVNGKGTASFQPAYSRAYYVELDNGKVSKGFRTVVEDKKRYAVRGSFSWNTAAAGEMVWVKGKAYLKGKAKSGLTVVLDRKKDGATKWTSLTSTTSTSSGAYSFRLAPAVGYSYRVHIKGTGAASGHFHIERTDADRSLESRAKQLASKLGTAKGSIKNVAAENLPSGVDAARYQVFTKGKLFEVTRSGKVRTWLVYGKIGDKYAALSGHKGKLGLPMRDAKCSLMEKGCVQRFTGGSLYFNASKLSKKKVYVAYGKVVETEILAAALSQVGYEEPSWRVNKYTKWLGSRPAWCMTFTAWAAAASGNGSMVPNSATYDKYVATMKKSGRLKYSGTPPVGAALLMDWSTGKPSHSALLVKVSGKYIYTVEGNTTDGSGDPQRGVYYRKRLLSDIWAWYMPSDK